MHSTSGSRPASDPAGTAMPRPPVFFRLRRHRHHGRNLWSQSSWPSSRYAPATIACPHSSTPRQGARLSCMKSAMRAETGVRPIVFNTLVDPEPWIQAARGGCRCSRLFEKFIEPPSKASSASTPPCRGRFHGIAEEPGVQAPHRGDQLHAGPRRRRLPRRPGRGRRDPGRREPARARRPPASIWRCSSASRPPTTR